MKRIIALLLTAILCLGLIGCGDNGANKEIVNIWTSMNGGQFVFNGNGTGSFRVFGTEAETTWKYDRELKTYIVASSRFGTQSVALKNDGETPYIECGNTVFYNHADFEARLPAHLEACRRLMEQDLGNLEKLELNKEYTTETLSVAFTLNTDDYSSLWLVIHITNNGTEPITLENFGTSACPIYAGYRISSYITGEKRGSVGGFGLNKVMADDKDAIAPGDTGAIKIELVQDAQWLLQTYGALIGFVSCSVGENAENKYLDFSDRYGK